MQQKSPLRAGFFVSIPKVSVEVFRFELANNITHNSSLRFRQSQITPEELLIHVGNFSSSPIKFSDESFFTAATKSQLFWACV